MKKVLLALTFAAAVVSVKAQVGIGTDTPKATLDVTAVNTTGTTTTAEGIIIPRVDRERAQSMQNVVKSTMIYVNGATTGTQTGTAINIDTEGFYYFNGTAWIKLPDAAQTLQETYWKAQGPTTSPKNGETSSKSATTPELYEVDIYQKGKVGIGYDNGNSIDFEVNTAQKQLEVGGDFRTFYTDGGATPRYLGIETNSIYAPDGYANKGTILYNSDQKDLRNLFSLDNAFDGNAIIQDKNGLNFSSRTGLNNDFEAISLDVRSNAFTIGAVKGTAIKNLPSIGTIKTYEKFRFFDFNTNEFKIVDSENIDMQMGYDFVKGKFYLGNATETNDGQGTVLVPKTQYYFPQTRPAKDKQILEYSQATESLEWVDGGASSAIPKFFYMPSVVLPTVSTDARIQATGNYTYDAATSVYSVKLYELFKAQFTTPVISSNTSSTLDEFVKLATGYDYFVTYADSTVFTNITLDANGLLTYKVNPNAIVRNGSFMNIVLKVK